MRPVVAAFFLTSSALYLGCTFYTRADDACVTGMPPNNGSGGKASGGSGSVTAGTAGIGGEQPMGEWTNVTSNLADMETICGNTGLIATHPGDGRIIAGVGKQGLWSSTDAGETWTQIAGSAIIPNSPAHLVFDPDDSSRFWLAGNHVGGFLSVTQDDGETFELLGDGVLAGLDTVSIDFENPERTLMLVGEHEISRALLRSTDGGETWENVGAGLPADIFCSTPHVIGADVYLVGCSNGEIYRTDDGAETWTKVSSQGSNRVPLSAQDGSMYWAGNDGSLVRSTDSGETWDQLLAPGSLFGSVPPIELADGRVVAFSQNGLVGGTPDDESWTLLTSAAPQTPYTITYSGRDQAFFAAYGNCEDVVPSDAIMRFDFESGDD